MSRGRGHCPFSRRGHRWGGRLDLLRSARISEKMIRVFDDAMRSNPALRICYDCDAPGRITSQGTTVEDPTMKPYLQLIHSQTPPPTAVKITPLAHRAKWARKPSEFDQKPAEQKK